MQFEAKVVSERGNPQQLPALHHAAHEQCYIVNSLTTDMRLETAVS